MKNRRLKWNTDYIKVSKNFKIDEKYIIEEFVNFKIINKQDFQQGTFTQIPKNILTFRTLIKNSKAKTVTLSQCRELKKIQKRINEGEIFSLSLERILNAGINTRILDRLRLLWQVKSSDGLINHILWYGYENGKRIWKQVKSERLKGSNNPGYQHGGKFSPFSKNFVKYSSEEEAEQKIKELQDQVSKTKDEEPWRKGDNNIEYYLYKGYSLEEAQILLKERQSTFSLDICIEKYGLEEGTSVWRERQDKWQETLKSKPQEEIDIINQKKGTGWMSQYFARNPEAKKYISTLYYLRFFNEEIEFWKIGITSRTVQKRFNSELRNNNLKYEILFEEHSNFDEVFKKEQRILKFYKEKRINIDYNGFKTTEAFSEDVLTIFELIQI